MVPVLDMNENVLPLLYIDTTLLVPSEPNHRLNMVEPLVNEPPFSRLPQVCIVPSTFNAANAVSHPIILTTFEDKFTPVLFVPPELLVPPQRTTLPSSFNAAYELELTYTLITPDDVPVGVAVVAPDPHHTTLPLLFNATNDPPFEYTEMIPDDKSALVLLVVTHGITLPSFFNAAKPELLEYTETTPELKPIGVG
jgi:hypothetical protein